MDVCDKLIELRIALTNACDGFSIENGNKNILLSSRIKLLYLLNEKDMTPAELIIGLGVAKSNLANLSKAMVEEGVIDSYKNVDNMRNVYYRISLKGQKELNEYKASLKDVFCSKFDDVYAIEKSIDDILNLLKRD